MVIYYTISKISINHSNTRPNRRELSGYRREAFYPCYGLAEATLIVSGSTKGTKPIVRTFSGTDLSQSRVVEVSADHEDARPLVGCGHNLPDGDIAIVEPNTLTTRPMG